MPRVVLRTMHVLLLALPSMAAAQRPDPPQELINIGRQRFADADYRGSDSIAVVVLGVSGLTRAQRIQALKLAAASRYPEERMEQHADSALAVLRLLVRIAPDASFSLTMTWRGLDSLLGVARRTTFGASASTFDSASLHGISDHASVDVVATRPTTFSLRLARPNDPGLGEVLDSIGPVVRGTLRFAPVQTDVPRYPTGTYRLTIIAMDPESGDRIDIVYQADFLTPPVTIAAIPVAVNPNDLRPERTSPSRVRAIVSGLLIGTFTYGSAQWLHNDVLRRAGVIPDSRATGWAVGLGVSASALAWYLDRGRLIMPNVEFNLKTRASFQAHQRSLREQNELARANYHGVIRLTPRDQ